jgi:hypothetical protein
MREMVRVKKREMTWQELTRLKQHWDAGIDLRKL